MHDYMYNTGQGGRVKRAVVARVLQRVHHVLPTSSFSVPVLEPLRIPVFPVRFAIRIFEPLRVPVRNGRDHVSGKHHPRVLDLRRARHMKI